MRLDESYSSRQVDRDDTENPQLVRSPDSDSLSHSPNSPLHQRSLSIHRSIEQTGSSLPRVEKPRTGLCQPCGPIKSSSCSSDFNSADTLITTELPLQDRPELDCRTARTAEANTNFYLSPSTKVMAEDSGLSRQEIESKQGRKRYCSRIPSRSRFDLIIFDL